MSDVVYCNLCFNEWFKDEWGVICPHCENENTEIVVLEDAPPTPEEVFVDGIIPEFLRTDIDRERARSWIYGGHADNAAAGSSTTENPSENARTEEVVVAVMGVTGSGKSTFIRTVTGNINVNVGHGLESDTSEVNSYRFTYQNTSFVIVDTPGFNDTSCSDEEIMTRVLEWLETSFRSGARLNGLIYLHRIIDPKMQGSALNNMRMFRKLCGPECFGNIILATTFWDDVPADLGAHREKQLKEKDEFWGKMAKKGSEVVRLGVGREEGMQLLLKIARKQKITLQSQREMVDENKSAGETAAAQSVHDEVRKQREEFEKWMEEERAENERLLEAQALEREQALEKERARAAEEERKRAEAAALQKAKEEREWKIEHARKQKEVREARQRAETEKKRQEEVERKKQEALDEQKRATEQLKAERQRYYRDYSCRRVNVSSMICDKCSQRVKDACYFHCCFCDDDNYDQCVSCGGCCPVHEHPFMVKRYMSDDCVVM